MRLKRVVLPAPFGPIIADNSPCSMRMFTWLETWMPPKCLSRSLISSIADNALLLLLFVVFVSRAEEPDAQNSPREHQNHRENRDAYEERPVLGVLPHNLFEAGKNRRPYHGSEEIAHAAHYGHKDCIPRHRPMEQIGRAS